MFVFKAAVVGAGTMGGQIAQTIAAAGIPRRPQGRRPGARRRTGSTRRATSPQGQVGGLVKKGKLTEEQAAAQVEDDRSGASTARPTYEGFGDVDFVIEAVPERMEIKQAVFAELDAVHARARDPRLQHLLAVDHRDRRRDAAPRQGRRLPLLLPGLGHAADRGHRGRRHLAGDDRAAVTFAQAIKKQPITCAEVPGFVVNRILNSGIAEIWREQEEKGLSIKKIDEGVGGRQRRARWARTSSSTCSASTPCCTSPSTSTSPTANRFYVPKGMQRAGRRRQARRQDRRRRLLLDPRASRTSRATPTPDVDELVEMLTLKTFVEAVPRARGGRRDPPRHRLRDDGRRRAGPAPRAAAAVHEGRHRGPRRRPGAPGGAPRNATASASRRRPILRRLVAQGRLGPKSGQGFYAYPQPDAEQPAGEETVVKLETRGEVAIAWLANGQMNSIAPQVIEDLRKVWEARVKADGVRSLVIASSNPMLFSAGADIKAFTQMDEAGGRELLDGAHALLRELEPVERRDDRRGQRPGLRRRLRAGDGLRRAHRGAVGDLRPARDQARDHPRLRRHAAAAAPGRREQGARDEPHRRPDLGARRPTSSASSTASWSTTSCSTPRSRGRASSPSQAPLAVAADQAGLGARATSTRASRPRRPASRPSSPVRGRQGGHQRLPGQAQADLDTGRERGARAGAARRPSVLRERPSPAPRRAGAPHPRRALGRRADRRRDLRALGDPGLPLAPARASGRTSTRWRSRTSTPGARTRSASGASTATASRRSRTRSPTARTGARRARAPRPARRGDHAEHRHAAPPRRHARARRGPRDDRARPRAWSAARRTRSHEVRGAADRGRPTACRAATAARR